MQRSSDFVEAAIRIGFELRNQYLIEYRPENHNWNGTYRRITVEVTQPFGLPPLHAYWRQGYYGLQQPCVLPTS